MSLKSSRGLTARKAYLPPDVGLDHAAPGAKQAMRCANGSWPTVETEASGARPSKINTPGAGTSSEKLIILALNLTVLTWNGRFEESNSVGTIKLRDGEFCT